jgi:hypothetical protein
VGPALSSHPIRKVETFEVAGSAQEAAGPGGMLLPADNVWTAGGSPATYMCQHLQAPEGGHKDDTLAKRYRRSASVSFWNRAN